MKKDTEKVTWRETCRACLRAAKLLERYTPGLFLSMGVNSVVSAVTPYVAVFFSARIIDELAGARRADILWRWVVAAVAVTGALALLNHLTTRWKEALDRTHWYTYQNIYKDKLLGMDFADLEKQETADLLAQIQQNEQWAGLGISNVPDCFESLVRGAAGVAGAVVLCAGLFLTPTPAATGTLAFLDGPVGLLALGLAIAVPMVLAPWLQGKVGAALTTEAMSDAATLGNRVYGAFGFLTYGAESVARALDIRMYDQQAIARHYISGERAFSADGPLARVLMGKGGLMVAASAGLSALTTGAVYLYVCLKAWAGAFGVGMATQYIGAVTALTGSMRELLENLMHLRNLTRYLRRTFQFLDIPNAMYQGSLTTEKRSDRQYDVEFRDVSFRYPGAPDWALRHVSVKFRVGKRLAVVGENGSGKTTFIKLLCRLYDPQEGQILLNGIDIRKYDYRDYMNIFSVVFQDFQLISQPLGANVAGSAAYDKERVTRALTDAGFGERLASLPDGLDTQLYRDYDGEGVQISGGEAQKIAIARALYKDAPFIVLDEPTAALDPMAEAEIYAQFNEISGDKTAIYISHRLSSCRFCDEILVFDRGQIVQQGAHEGLLAEEGGKYHQLWHAQAQYYDE